MDSNNNFNLGQVKITIYYDEEKSLLFITLHEAKELINTDKKGLTDPYAILVLSPDAKKETEKQSNVIKDNLNPVWEQTFDYVCTFAEASSKTLLMTFHDQKGFFERQSTTYLGEVSIPLGSLKNIKESVTNWYYLQPSSTSATHLLPKKLLQ